MSLPDRVVRRPIATLAITALILTIGLVSLWKTSLDLLPDIKPPLIAIITVFPGSSPQETLQLVTEPIEAQVAAIGGITNLSSLSQENISMVLLRFQWGANLNSLRDEVKAHLDLLPLPDGAARPIVLKFDPTLLPVMQVAVSSSADTVSLTGWLELHVKPLLEKVPGVASVSIQGGASQGLFVRLDPTLMAQQRISFDQVANILRASLLDLPAGITELDQERQRLRFLGRPADIETLQKMVIGFQVDEQAIREMLGRSLDFNLNESFSSFFALPDLKDIPMRTIYVRDVAPGIRLNEQGSAIIIELDRDLLERFNLQPQLLSILLPLEWNPHHHRGNIVIPLPPGSGLDEETIKNTPLVRVPDFEMWLLQIQEKAEQGLKAASGALEQSLTEMAAAIIAASATGRGGLPPGDGFPLQPVTLGSIARVETDLRPASTISRVNGRPSVTLSIQKEGDANTVAVSRQVEQVLQEIKEVEATLEHPFYIHTIYNQAREIENALSDLAWALAWGSFLAVAVLLIFLKNWRTVVIIGLSIPMAVITTFALLYFANLTVNLMTLGGLALAAGMLVDNAIIVSENIYRRYQMGESPVKAAVSGSHEVTGAVLASTLTTISVFVPVAFISGLARELFRDFAQTVSCALLASLIIALTIIPLLTSRLLGKRPPDSHPGPAEYSGFYRRILERALQYPWAVVAVSLLFVALSLLLYPRLDTNLFPAPEEKSFYIDLTLPPGTPLHRTDSVVKQVEQALAGMDAVSDFFTRVGENQFFGLPLEGGNANKARIWVHASEEWAGRLAEVIREVRKEVEPLLEKGQAVFTRESLLDATGLETKLELIVEGEAVEGVKEISTELVKRLQQLPAVTDALSLLEETRPEIQARLQHGLALQKGMTVYQTASLLHQGLEGTTVARLETEQGLLDLILCYSDSGIETLSDLEQISFYTPSGAYMELGDVAVFSEGYGPASIPRENHKVVGVVQAQYRGNLGTVSAEAMRLVEQMQLPLGYTVRVTGTAALMQEVFDELKLVLLLAALLIYLVMAAQFESLLHPLIIILSLPLAFGGSIIALLLAGQSLNVPALIGAVVLAGILVNDGIIMVDFINQQRRLHGQPLRRAIITGAVTRLRPILMTTTTTILGLIPLSLALGQGSQLQAPMAIVIIGGQVAGTALLLVAIPAIYLLFNRDGGQAT